MNKRLFFVFLTSLSKVPRREILQVRKKCINHISEAEATLIHLYIFFVEYTATVESCASIQAEFEEERL